MKKVEILSISFINLTWITVIGVWFLQFLDNEIGNVVRTYCFGYGVYSRDVVMLRTILMFLTPAFLSLLLLFIFHKSKTFRSLFVLTYIIVFITFLLVNALVGKLNRPIQISYNLKISEMPQNLNLLDEEGNPFFFDSSKVYIITFFYSRCQASCPLQIELVKKLSKKFLNYNFILISFDPRDKKGDLYELKIKYALGENVKLLKGDGEGFSDFLFDLGFPKDFEGDIINHPVVFLICN